MANADLDATAAALSGQLLSVLEQTILRLEEAKTSQWFRGGITNLSVSLTIGPVSGSIAIAGEPSKRDGGVILSLAHPMDVFSPADGKTRIEVKVTDANGERTKTLHLHNGQWERFHLEDASSTPPASPIGGATPHNVQANEVWVKLALPSDDPSTVDHVTGIDDPLNRDGYWLLHFDTKKAKYYDKPPK
jgi:hypothetical protein